jgi:hypothetical protein
LLKLMIMYELHGLNDIAVDTVERFADRLNRYVLSPMCSGWTHGLWGRQGSPNPGPFIVNAIQALSQLSYGPIRSRR